MAKEEYMEALLRAIDSDSGRALVGGRTYDPECGSRVIVVDDHVELEWWNFSCGRSRRRSEPLTRELRRIKGSPE